MVTRRSSRPAVPSRRRARLRREAGSGPEWLPAGAVAYADFRNGHYYAGGAETTLGGMFVENTDWSGFNPATVVPGVGLNHTPGDDAAPVLTGAALSAVLAGATVVIDCEFYDFSSSNVGFDIVDLPDYNREFGPTYVGVQSGRYYTGGAQINFDRLTLVGWHKLAFTFKSDGDFAMSIDGDAVLTGTNEGAAPAPNAAAIGIYNGNIRSITIYPVQDDADLPALSDTGAPTITSSASVSVAENATLSHALTVSSGSVSWAVAGGSDSGELEVSGSTLRWASNGTQDYEAPGDFDADNVYEAIVSATADNDAVRGQAISVTVTDVAEATAYRYWRINIDDAYNAYCSFSEVQLRETSGGANVASGGTASASSTYGTDVPANALDGNNSTFWASNGDSTSLGKSYWQYDFGSGNAKVITEVVIRCRSDDASQAPKALAFMGSNDGTTWVTIWAETGIAAWSNGQSRTFTKAAYDPTARYWRTVFFDAQGNPNYVSVAELQMYETSGGSNIATNTANASASSAYGAGDTDGPASKAFDNSNSTFWTNSLLQFPAWLKYDFGASNDKNLAEIAIRIRGDGNHDDPVNFVIQRSADNSTWTTIWRPPAAGAWGTGERRVYTKPTP